MAYNCTICGESLQSDGAAGLHELVAHLNAPPPPPPPNPGAAIAFAPPAWPTTDQRSQAAGRMVTILAVALTAAIVTGALVAVVVNRSRRQPATTVSAAADPGSARAEEVAAGSTGTTPAPAAAAAAARPGVHTVTKADQGFAVDLPDAMTELPLTRDGLAQAANMMASVNPALAGVMKGNDKLAEQVRLFAMDPATGRTQLVQRIPGARGMDIKDAPRGLFSSEYRKYGASADEAQVQLPAGDALLVSAQLPMGAQTVTVTQYVLTHGGSVWILTTAGPDSGKNGADIAATFRFV